MKLQQEENRVFAEDENGNLIAEITFPAVYEGLVDIDHTFVDASLRGQGVADQLVRTAIECIKNNGRRATASCSYAVRWFDKHPEACDVLEDH